MDIITYLDNNNVNERKLYFIYLTDYPSFVSWANKHNIDLTASYTDIEDGFTVNSSLYLWIENMEAY